MDILSNIFLVIALLIELKNYNRITTIPTFKFWLLTIVILEVVIISIMNSIYIPNLLLYNIISLLYIGYYFYLYFPFIENKVSKRIAFYVLGLILSIGIYFIFIYGTGKVIGWVYVLGLMLNMVLIINYFTKKIKYQEMLSLKDPYFILGVSILVFFTTNFPMLLFINDMIAGYDFPKIYFDMLKLGNMLLFVGYLVTAYYNSTHKNVDFIKNKFSSNAR